MGKMGEVLAVHQHFGAESDLLGTPKPSSCLMDGNADHQAFPVCKDLGTIILLRASQ